VLEILETPFSTPVAQMLEEDVGRTIGENQGALDEFG
jgi:hypothetical protein